MFQLSKPRCSHRGLNGRRRLAASATAILVALGLTSCGGSMWVGLWETTDTRGDNYVISLFDNGEAVAGGSQNTRGVWSEEDDRAYIVWNTGWQGILSENEDGTYTKQAFAPGERFGSPSGKSSLTRH